MHDVLTYFFHFFPNFKGGFIGVDFFFIISGFVITRLIIKNIKNETFSFIDFYKRRILRLFPSLLILLFLTFTFSYFIFDQNRLINVLNQIQASNFFYINFHLMREIDYFDIDSIYKPLLHLWSLSIEEQFYLFWPILIFIFFKFFKNIFVFFFLLLIFFYFIHIYTNIVFGYDNAFYFSPARVWQLILGALTSIIINLPIYEKIKFIFMNRILNICSIIIIFFALFFESPNLSIFFISNIIFFFTFVFLILSQDKIIISLLSKNYLRYVGLISYPLYLIHFPILSLYTFKFGELNFSEKIIAIIICFAFASLVYEKIEKPIRYNKKNKNLAVYSLLVIYLLFVIFVEYKKNNLKVGVLNSVAFNEIIGNDTSVLKYDLEYNDDDISHDSFFYNLNKNHFPCQNETINNESQIYRYDIDYDKYINRCFQSKYNDVPDLVLIGDSHAEHFYPGFADMWPNLNISYFNKPDPPYITSHPFKKIFKYINENKKIKTIILSAKWDDLLVFRKQWAINNNTSLTIEEEIIKLLSNLDKKKKIILLNDVPTFNFHPLECQNDNKCSSDLQKYISLREKINDILQSISKSNKNIYFIKSSEKFCETNNFKCNMKYNERVLYRDPNHLNFYGSKFIVNEIKNEIDKIIDQ